MKATTMLDTLSSMLGRPACAIPLSFCRISRPYLLERAGIPPSGTALLFTVPYLVSEDIQNPTRNVSLYAVPRDYHGYVLQLRDILLPRLEDAFPRNHFALFSDHSPIQEIHAAARAGLGVIGKNSLLLTPTYGSFVFIAEVMTDADYTIVTGSTRLDFPAEPPTCEGCGACLRACPARQGAAWTTPCLSALTQKKGSLSPAETATLAAHPLVWGCDTCQLVCPHNRKALQGYADTPISYFSEHRLPCIDLDTLSLMSDEAFSARAYAWRGRSVITRNCILKEEST